jgi:hypothetical protein
MTDHLRFLRKHSSVFSSDGFQKAFRTYRNMMNVTKNPNTRAKIEDAWRRSVLSHVRDFPTPVYDDHLKLHPKPIYDKTWKSSGNKEYDDENMINANGNRVFSSKGEYKRALMKYEKDLKRYKTAILNRRAADMCGVLFRNVYNLLEFRNNKVIFMKPMLKHVNTFETNVRHNFVL